MAEGVQGAEIHACLFSPWGKCSFSGKCIRIDRNVKELRTFVTGPEHKKRPFT